MRDYTHSHASLRSGNRAVGLTARVGFAVRAQDPAGVAHAAAHVPLPCLRRSALGPFWQVAVAALCVGSRVAHRRRHALHTHLVVVRVPWPCVPLRVAGRTPRHIAAGPSNRPLSCRPVPHHLRARGELPRANRGCAGERSIRAGGVGRRGSKRLVKFWQPAPHNIMLMGQSNSSIAAGSNWRRQI